MTLAINCMVNTTNGWCYQMKLFGVCAADGSHIGIVQLDWQQALHPVTLNCFFKVGLRYSFLIWMFLYFVAPGVNHTGVVHKSHLLCSVQLRQRTLSHGIHLRFLQLPWTCTNTLCFATVLFCGEENALTKESFQQKPLTMELFKDTLPKKYKSEP